MPPENPKFSEQEDRSLEKRAVSDAELIREGARFDNGVLRPTDRQIENAAREMSKALSSEPEHILSYRTKVEKRGRFSVEVSNRGFERLLDARTGKRMYAWVSNRVEDVAGWPVAYNGSRAILIHPNSGKELGEYDSVFERDGLIIGRVRNKECLINRRTGEQATELFKQIERRGDQIVGVGISTEELIPREAAG